MDKNMEPTSLMDTSMYNLEVNRVAKEIRRLGAKKVLIQLPDGLRPTAFSLAETLRKLTDAEIILSGDSCYGACDLALTQAKALGADLIVHYGHSKMMEVSSIPVMYVEAFVDFDVEALIEKTIPLAEGWERIGLAATVQHVHRLGEAAEILKKEGFHPILGTRGDKTAYDGQILGCDYHSAKSIAEEVNGYIFVGGGRFHPLGLAITTGKPVVIANPYTLSAELLGYHEVTRLAMRRMAAIKAAEDAHRFGVIVSLKPGQFQMETARLLSYKLKQSGKEATIICLDEVDTVQLMNFSEAEAFISTACPRIAVDGVADIDKPILTVVESQIMLGEKRWEDVWGHSYFN
jgi:2-(3-amino-3-carboxypropyl)histidine synthase